jgi:hypothetical protein
MKIETKTMTWFLTLLALLTAPHLASAYYDPGVQRWINRDPINELGFEALPRGRGAAIMIGASHSPGLFTFVGNQPVRNLDIFGLEIFIPPPSFPKGGAVNGENPGTIGGIIYGNFPDCRPSKPTDPCTTPNKKRNIKPAGTMTRECPCTGTVTVQCTQYQSCDFWSMGTTGGATYGWMSHTDCAPCPEYAL